jgi:hypothetical protein
VPLRWLLGHRAHDQALECRVDVFFAARPDRIGRVVDLRHQDLDDAALERQRPGEQEVAEHAERVDVARDGRRAAGGALGCEVVRAAADAAFLVGGVAASREPEVEQADDTSPACAARTGHLGGEHDVLRLDVAVDDAALVNVIECLGDLTEDVDRALHRHRQGAGRDEGLALDELHHHVCAELCVLAEIDDAHDVGMRDFARELRFLVEANACSVISRERRRDDLQGERLAELDVARLVDVPHAAFAELPVQRVAAAHRLHEARL